MDELFFYGSKIIWMFISPVNLLLITLLAAVICSWLGYAVAAKRLFRGIIIVIVMLSVIPVGSWLLHPLETRFKSARQLPEIVDGIIILGGSVDAYRSSLWGQLEVNQHAERINALITLSRQYPQARVVFTGGNSNMDRERSSEAEILKLYLPQLGILADRVEFEVQSRNTADNAMLTHEMVKPASNSTWLLVTTAFHMPRSIGVFCQLGWSLIPYPVDHITEPELKLGLRFNVLANLNQLDWAAHEWTGLIAYYLTGKTNQLFPQECE